MYIIIQEYLLVLGISKLVITMRPTSFISEIQRSLIQYVHLTSFPHFLRIMKMNIGSKSF